MGEDTKLVIDSTSWYIQASRECKSAVTDLKEYQDFVVSIAIDIRENVTSLTACMMEHNPR